MKKGVRDMQNYYYQVLINGKPFPYEDSKIWNKASAMVHLKQAEAVVKTHDEYKDKDCTIELIKVVRLNFMKFN